MLKDRKRQADNGFRCCHCAKEISSSGLVGTKHRNHCPYCLWSKHLDLKKSGDRKSSCKKEMSPIGLTFKHEGMDKYKKIKQGELMLVHRCSNLNCKKISINRIAGDDNPETILRIFQESQRLNLEEKNQLKQNGIEILPIEAKEKILIQLFGKEWTT